MRRLLYLGLICGVLLWSGSVWALSTASTTCYLDWDSLRINGNADYEWSWEENQYSYLRADARNDFQNIDGSPITRNDKWGEYSTVTATNAPSAVGIAETGEFTVDWNNENRTFDGLFGATSAETDGSTTTTAHAAANVRRTGDMTIYTQSAESIDLDFSIDYYIRHAFSTSEVAEDAGIYTELHFKLGEGAEVPEDFLIINQLMEAGELTGTLTFSATLTSGTYGLQADIWTWSDAYSPESAAPVPEPSTIVLMGLGLVGLAGYGRKRLKA
jgi:hypothetical protein